MSTRSLPAIRAMACAVAAVGLQLGHAAQQANAPFTVSATLNPVSTCRFSGESGVIECRTPPVFFPELPMPSGGAAAPGPIAPEAGKTPGPSMPGELPASAVVGAPPKPSFPAESSTPPAQQPPARGSASGDAAASYWPWQRILYSCRFLDSDLADVNDALCQVKHSNVVGAVANTRLVSFGGRDYLELTLSW